LAQSAAMPAPLRRLDDVVAQIGQLVSLELYTIEL
jgi:hypothetical protein